LDVTTLPKTRVRLKVVFDGTRWKVDLPHYEVVPGTWEPVTESLVHENGPLPDADIDEVKALEPTVQVDVPDRIMDPVTGRPSKERIRELYRGQPDWDHDRVTDDL
jgi:hypothetical protein